MINFLKNLVGPKEATPLPTLPDGLLPDYDEDYIRYCIEQDQVLSSLEACLHSSDDPDEIAGQTLKTACAFYGGDWAGLVTVDFDINIWSLLWWYNPRPNDRTSQFLKELESSDYLNRWLHSMEDDSPVIVEDVELLKEKSPEEYALYQRVKACSILAVPFKPRPRGFLVIRNPSRYINRSSMLQVLAYVALNTANQKKMMESVKLIKRPEDINNDKEIVIRVFGAIEIHSATGVLTQEKMKSPLMCRMLLFLLLNNRSAQTAMNIASVLWPEDDSLQNQEARHSNLRGIVYRFRQLFSLISPYDLVVTTNSGYRLNPDLRIITDMENFDRAWDAVQNTSSTAQKMEMIKQAMSIYNGEIYSPARGEHWLSAWSHHYRSRYLALANELLCKLASSQDWDAVCRYASQCQALVSDDMRTYFWLIYGLYKTGSVELARGELQRAKAVCTEEEYRDLITMLQQLKETA